MTSPFHNKSPAELLAMLPDLADPDLDALCANYCDGWEYGPVDILDGGHPVLMWSKEPNRQRSHSINQIRPKYTSDPREAMRLLVKYQLELGPQGYCGKPDIYWECAPRLEDVRGAFDEPVGCNDNPCRAIIEAAVVCELTKLIEEDGE